MTATDIPARQEPAETDLASWRVESHPVQIEYSRAVLQNVRRIFEDNSNRDVAGVLFGTYGKDLVRILGHRPGIRENAEGLSVPLGERDNTTLLELLKAPLTDPQLKGLHPVGWYHAKAGAIQLAPGDLAVYNRYFPVRWQIALVLDVKGGKASRGGFFVREKIGPMRSESSYCEFTVDSSEAAAPLVQPAPSPVAPLPAVPPQAAPVNGAASIRPVPAVEKPVVRPAAAVAPAQKSAAAPGTIRPFMIPATATKEEPVIAPVVKEPVKEEQKPVVTRPDAPKPANPLTPQPKVRPVEKRPTPEPKPGTPEPAPVLSPGQGEATAEKPAVGSAEEAAPAASGGLWGLVRNRPRWLWISLAAVLLVGIVVLVAARRHATASLQTVVLQNGGLSLKAEKDGDGLRVNWDREAPPVQHAQRAVLTITDGARKEQINLGVNELQSGSVMYAPVSADVNFQLSVYGKGNQGVTESVRIVSSRPSPLADLASAKPAIAKPVLLPPPTGLAGTSDSHPGAPALVGSGIATSAPAPPPEPPAAKVTEQPRPPTAQAPDEPGRSTAAPTVAQNKPAQPSPPVQSKPVETPPPPVQKAPEPPKPQAAVQQQPPASKPPAPAAQQQTASKPPAPVVQQPAPTPAPPAQQAGGNYVGPKPTRKVMPDVPANIRHLMVGATVIDVKINVDANGQVTDAIATSRTKGNKLGEYLGVRAAQAARLWRFDPAKLDGKNVPAETVVQFKF